MAAENLALAYVKTHLALGSLNLCEALDEENAARKALLDLIMEVK